MNTVIHQLENEKAPSGISLGGSRQQLRAGLLSLSVLSCGLLTLWLGHQSQEAPTDQLVIREVALATPPPPPPPPPVVQQTSVETPVTLQVSGEGPSLQMMKVEQKIEVAKPDLPGIETRMTQWQPLEVDWNAFELKELDGLPKLLTPLRITFPASLRRRGINRVNIKLDVVIDEQGQVTLVDIVHNPHPELVSEIQRMVRNSRFTAPTKDKEPVRARFIWPMEIES